MEKKIKNQKPISIITIILAIILIGSSILAIVSDIIIPGLQPILGALIMGCFTYYIYEKYKAGRIDKKRFNILTVLFLCIGLFDLGVGILTIIETL